MSWRARGRGSAEIKLVNLLLCEQLQIRNKGQMQHLCPATAQSAILVMQLFSGFSTVVGDYEWQNCFVRPGKGMLRAIMQDLKVYLVSQAACTCEWTCQILVWYPCNIECWTWWGTKLLRAFKNQIGQPSIIEMFEMGSTFSMSSIWWWCSTPPSEALD